MTSLQYFKDYIRERELDTDQAGKLAHLLADGGYAYDKPVVGPLEFIDHPEYMDAAGVMWTKVRPYYAELNSGEYTEACLTGGLGSAKTTIALYTIAYQLYLLSVLEEPHRIFGLDPAHEMVFIFQNIKESLARSVDYDRFRAMCERAPYFKNHFPFDEDFKSEMKFPKRIVVRPVSGEATAAIGQNVCGGLIDEINFMVIVEKSKRAKGSEDTYDQALANYSALARRRATRFMRAGGKMPGILCVASSRVYPGEFTDTKIAEAQREAREKGKSKIFVYDKRVWEICPPGRFSGEMFRLFTGDESRQPRKLQGGEEVPEVDKELVCEVPTEFEAEFDRDIMNATREIAGFSTQALHPWLPNIAAVEANFGRSTSILNQGQCDFKTSVLRVMPDRIRHHMIPRMAHIDLGLTSDAAGVCMGHVRGFKRVKRMEGFHELLPIIVIDFLLRTPPPAGDEVQFWKLRDLLYTIRDKAGINLKWVTFDSWHSYDSRQILRKRGFMTGEISMDKTMNPWSICKTALYDGRVWAPAHPPCQGELRALEIDRKKGKIDHRPGGSKDVADALTGVIFGLSTRREIWLAHGISPMEIPDDILAAASKVRDDKRQAAEDAAETAELR